MAHAIYLSIPTIVIPAPRLDHRTYLPSYARAIADLLQMGEPSAFTQIAIRIPVSDPAELIGQGAGPSESNTRKRHHLLMEGTPLPNGDPVTRGITSGFLRFPLDLLQYIRRISLRMDRCGQRRVRPQLARP